MRLGRSRAATVLAVGAICVLPAPAGASGGTFDVVKCSSQNRSHGGLVESTNAFVTRSDCGQPDDFAFKVESASRAAKGRRARISWTVEEPLGITGVNVEAKLRSADGYRAHLYMADADGRITEQVAIGGHGPTRFEPYQWSGKPQRRFFAELVCTEGPSCDPSEQAQTWIRNLRFEVADYSDPEVEVDGSLLVDGWQRADRDFELSANDLGAGLARVEIEVNGSVLESTSPTCSGAVSTKTAAAFEPCPLFERLAVVPSTLEPPFVDGANVLRACATDFAENVSCAVREVLIDNETPAAAFASQDPQDPELIRVPVHDEFSGLAAGAISFRASGASEWRPLSTQVLDDELRARVDSAAETPGTYEFMASVTDVAGNSSQTTIREDGTPMTLEFPLRSGVQLNAHIEPGGSRRTTLKYGKNALAKGRLLDAAGQPLPNQPVTVDENFGEGALIDHRVRTVITDEAGRWSSKLPAGPNRSVSVSYPGDQRYLDTETTAGRLLVKTGAKLGLTRKRVPEGRSTIFKGRVERLGARIPSRGKTLQLQYQDPGSGRWFTVRNPFRTKSDGRFSFKYSFGTHYLVDVAIRFRLKVPSERGWPYRGTTTGAERVIVEARP